MFIKRKRLEDKSENDRQLVIVYKKTFSSPEGKEVLLDLMNRYNILNPIRATGQEADRMEGARSVVCDIVSRVNIDLAQFEKLLKGEL